MSVIAGQTDPAQKPNTAVIKLLENQSAYCFGKMNQQMAYVCLVKVKALLLVYITSALG